MPPPTVKRVNDIPFKSLFDSNDIKLVKSVDNPEFRYVIASPLNEIKTNIHSPKVLPDVGSSADIPNLKEIAKTKQFAAGAGSSLILPNTSPTTILIGSGKLDDGKVTSRSAAKKMAEAVATHIRDQRPLSVSVEFPEMTDEAFPFFLAYFKFAMYVEDRFRIQRSKNIPHQMSLAFPNHAARFEQLVKEGDEFAESMIFNREVADAPPNYCHPSSVLKACQTVASEGGMEIRYFDWHQCDKMGMGGFCAVSQGMSNEPYFVHMIYRNGTPTHRIAYIGKGVCMDTGGYALKPTASMIDMHHDMGGAAVTLTAAKLLCKHKPENAEIHFIVPLVENLVDSQAYLNGDVIKTMSGLSVLIKNTDAEGRMILCDGITYAQKIFEEEKAKANKDIPQTIVTTATLTGAAIIALGKKMAPFYSTSDTMAKLAEDASKTNVDKIWRFPLSDEHYNLLNEDDRGDLPNVSKLGAGSVTAAHFLKEFVQDETINYLHFDIAGPMTNAKSQSDAYGAIMFTDFIESMAKHQE